MRAAVLLAAGRSRRFIGANKLLARRRGVPLVRAALRSALNAPVGRVIVVIGHDRAKVAHELARLRGPRVRLVIARNHARGMGASLRAGLEALWPAERNVFVFHGDMPAVPRWLPVRLARALRPGDLAVRPADSRGPGHPVLLRRPLPEKIRSLCGDSGLGALIAGRTRMIVSCRRLVGDIDTRRDMTRWG